MATIAKYLKDFIVYFPQIYAIIKEILSWLGKKIDAMEKKRKLEELKEGISIAKDTKDTSHLERVFNERMFKRINRDN